jgi:DNA-binding NarL/FixJ family response regulator
MIVDDQQIIRDGTGLILSTDKEINIAGYAGNGKEALLKLQEICPDIILMDIRMPDMDGVEATKSIKKEYQDIKIIILTTFDDDEYIFEALKNGASCYLLKDVGAKELIQTVKDVYKGNTVIKSEIAEKMMSGMNKASERNEIKELLSNREMEICKHICKGQTNAEIAASLYLSEGTVKNHITNILSKLHLKKRTQIAIKFMEDKII